MSFAFVPLILAALLCESTAATLLQRPSASSGGPAFVWGSTAVLQTDGQHASKVIYEVRQCSLPCLQLLDNAVYSVSEASCNSLPWVTYVHVVILQDFDSKRLADGLWKTLSQQQDADVSATSNPSALLVFVGNKVSILGVLSRPQPHIMQAKVRVTGSMT